MKTDRNMEDMALLSSLRKGEQQAFDSLFRKYYPMLCAYARRFVELEDAEETIRWYKNCSGNHALDMGKTFGANNRIFP